jgi:hypothetical protein
MPAARRVRHVSCQRRRRRRQQRELTAPWRQHQGLPAVGRRVLQHRRRTGSACGGSPAAAIGQPALQESHVLSLLFTGTPVATHRRQRHLTRPMTTALPGVFAPAPRGHAGRPSLGRGPLRACLAVHVCCSLTAERGPPCFRRTNLKSQRHSRSWRWRGPAGRTPRVATRFFRRGWQGTLLCPDCG